MQCAKFNRLVIIRNTKMPYSVEMLFARFSKLLMCMFDLNSQIFYIIYLVR